MPVPCVVQSLIVAKVKVTGSFLADAGGAVSDAIADEPDGGVEAFPELLPQAANITRDSANGTEAAALKRVFMLIKVQSPLQF